MCHSNKSIYNYIQHTQLSVSSGLSSSNRQTGQVKCSFWHNFWSKIAVEISRWNHLKQRPNCNSFRATTFHFVLYHLLIVLTNLKTKKPKSGRGYKFFCLLATASYNASLLGVWFPMEVWCAGLSVSAPRIKYCCCFHDSITKGTE